MIRGSAPAALLEAIRLGDGSLKWRWKPTVSAEEIDGSLLSLLTFVDALGDLEEAGIDIKALLSESGQLVEPA